MSAAFGAIAPMILGTLATSAVTGGLKKSSAPAVAPVAAPAAAPVAAPQDAALRAQAGKQFLAGQVLRSANQADELGDPNKRAGKVLLG